MILSSQPLAFFRPGPVSSPSSGASGPRCPNRKTPTLRLAIGDRSLSTVLFGWPTQQSTGFPDFPAPPWPLSSSAAESSLRSSESSGAQRAQHYQGTWSPASSLMKLVPRSGSWMSEP